MHNSVIKIFEYKNRNETHHLRPYYPTKQIKSYLSKRVNKHIQIVYYWYMNIYESAEDYLERILILQEKNDGVRSIDIAHDMGFSKPSISIAMKKLKEAGLIDIDEHGYITLTKEGHVIADKVYERHKVLTKVMIDMGVSPEQAEKDACKVEHVISEETFQAIKKKMKWRKL